MTLSSLLAEFSPDVIALRRDCKLYKRGLARFRGKKFNAEGNLIDKSSLIICYKILIRLHKIPLHMWLEVPNEKARHGKSYHYTTTLNGKTVLMTTFNSYKSGEDRDGIPQYTVTSLAAIYIDGVRVLPGENIPSSWRGDLSNHFTSHLEKLIMKVSEGVSKDVKEKRLSAEASARDREIAKQDAVRNHIQRMRDLLK